MDIGRTHEMSEKKDRMSGKTTVVMGRTHLVNSKTMEIGRTHEVSGKLEEMTGRTAV